MPQSKFRIPKLKILGIFLAASLLMTGVIVSLFIFQMKQFIETPCTSQERPVTFTITPGQNLKQIAANLENQGLITSQSLFNFYVQYKKAATRLKAGEYQLSAHTPPYRILDQLLKGRDKLYRLTIPEGLNMDEIALLVQKANMCDTTPFLSLCRDTDFIKMVKVNSHSLEGYLYPDTYFFPKQTTCRQIIEKMVGTFHKIYTREWEKRSEKLGFSVHEIVTLAAIIEKETGNASERPLISSVFHNRLKQNMRLESDPTVIYGDKKFGGRIRTRHLRRKTPYNTYQLRGLPLGPIANPGALAIKAALYPDTSP
ncbi:MAG: endolytic transglycosylase MltG, partial [Deltaproteobacteria bacterium]